MVNFEKNIKYGILFGCTLLVLLSTPLAFAGNYYVSTAGNDTDPGTSSKPFRTIQHAVDIAQPGDKVIVRAGIYYERIVMKNSGTDNNPIVFQGERDTNGNWLTIIDGGDATSGWVAAPEVGTDVYKKVIGYCPWAMTIDGDVNVGRLSTPVMTSGKGNKFLARGINATEAYAWDDTTTNINVWDGWNAAFGYLISNKTTYIRIADGGDPNPNNRNTRSSPGPPGANKENCFSCTPPGQVIMIYNQSYNTIRDFEIRGARVGVYISSAHHNIIEENHIINGQTRIKLYNGAYSNTIRNNDMENKMSGFETHVPGPWEKATNVSTDYTDPYGIRVNRRLYNDFKYRIGETTESNADTGVHIYKAGNDNEIYSNTIHNGCVGVSIVDTNNTKIYRNTFYNLINQAVWIHEYIYGTEIYGNTLYNSNNTIRIQSLEKGRRTVYIYRNKFYNPPLLGNHFYFHVLDKLVIPSKPAEVYIYHNSFSGGYAALSISGFLDDIGGIPGFRFVNNIFSANYLYITWTEKAFLNNSGMIGLFAYNWVGGKYYSGTPAWLGSPSIFYNINSKDSTIWSVTSLSDFILPSTGTGSDANNVGIDLSKPFVINGISYPALPGMQTGYVSGTNPNMGAVTINVPKGLRFPE